MENFWKDLTEKEKELLFDAPVFISILIGGADDDFDSKEKSWAQKLTHYRTFTSKDDLHEYYTIVDDIFDTRIETLMDVLPETAKDRNPIIAKKLAELSPVLKKLDSKFAQVLYDSLKTFAEHIAKSSGGIFGFLTIGPEETSWKNLEMIERP